MNNPNQNPNQARFAIERVYVKDISFESPRAPEVFAEQWNPKVNAEISSRAKALKDNRYEVVVEIKITAKQNDEDVFITEIEQAGLFHVEGIPQAQLDHFLGAYCPNILFPYARETVDSLNAKGSMPPLMMSPINFEQIFAQKMQQQQAAAAKK